MREKTLNDIYHETEIYRSQINNFKSFPNINMVVKARYIPSHKYEISFYAQNNKTFLETYCPESIRGNQEFVGNILFKFNLEKTRLKYAILDASQYSHKSYLAEINLSHFEVDYNGLSQTYIDILKTELPMIEDIYRISWLPEHIDYNQIKIMQEYDISLEELDAFYGYKWTDYSDINEFMRFARGKKNKILDPLLSGLNKLPNTEWTFYRQINFNEISYNKFLKDMRERKESKMLWSDKGIMSVSSSDQIHQSMSRGSQYEIEILIESNTAKDIRSLNLNKSEDEFLITPWKEFEVVNIIENSKSWTAEIHLRQVEMNELDLWSYDIWQNIIIPRSDGTISEWKINSYDSNSWNYIVTWSDSKGSYKKSLTKEQLNNVNVLNWRMDPKITKNKSNMSVIN